MATLITTSFAPGTMNVQPTIEGSLPRFDRLAEKQRERAARPMDIGNLVRLFQAAREKGKIVVFPSPKTAGPDIKRKEPLTPRSCRDGLELLTTP